METTYNLNSNLLPFINVAMYGTFLDPEYTLYTDLINDDKNEGYINYNEEQFWEGFNNNEYIKHIQEHAALFYDGKYTIEGINFTLKLGEIYSPKYYNFNNDCIDIDIEINKNDLLKFARKNKDAFNSYLKDNYSSYDGFSSFTPNNFLEWEYEFTKNNHVQSIAAIINYLVNFEECEELPNYEEFLNFINENSFYSEFYNGCEALEVATS